MDIASLSNITQHQAAEDNQLSFSVLIHAKVLREKYPELEAAAQDMELLAMMFALCHRRMNAAMEMLDMSKMLVEVE